MKISLEGKNVVLTGASSGIGWEASCMFAEQGANIAIAARSLDKLDELEKKLLEYGVKVLKVQTDVSKATESFAAAKSWFRISIRSFHNRQLIAFFLQSLCLFNQNN